MNGMEKIDREKVIKGLECCNAPNDHEHCPYDGEEHYNICTHKLLTDAIALLKAQEPRVMTLEEAQGDDEVWFEFRPSNVGRYADCYMSESGLRTCVYFTGKSVMSLFENSEYGKTWRCWTSHPTDAQREATAWDV